MAKGEGSRFRGKSKRDEEGEGVDVLATPKDKLLHISDHLAVVAGAVLFLMLALLALLLYLNTMADIKHWDGAKNGVLAVYNLDTIHDVAAAATKKDKDDLLETYAAVDSIERAVQHGNIAGARMVLQQLIGSNTLQASDVAALTKLIEDAEAENPIIDIAACRAPNALNFVKEKGGSIISEGKGEEADWALMMADFDHDQQQADGRGRGIAALKEIKEGEVLLEVPGGAQMSIKSAASTPKLEHIFKAESRASGGVLGSFNGLALFLLHESHRTDSYFRPYICSLPLHVPLPFLWADTDLPPDFLADHKIVADRKLVRELVELSYNVTVPPMLEKYPEVFKAEHFSTSKWAWACSIILSRALALGASAGTSQLLDAEVIDPAVVLQALKDPAQAEPPAVHTLVPVVDMINHESNQSLRCALTVTKDGTFVVTAGASGLKRGYEIAFSYSNKLCGAAPLNRWGFVLAACPGEEGAETAKADGDAAPAAAE